MTTLDLIYGPYCRIHKRWIHHPWRGLKDGEGGTWGCDLMVGLVLLDLGLDSMFSKGFSNLAPDLKEASLLLRFR